MLAGPAPALPGSLVVLADPSLPLGEAWDHRSFGAATEYSRVVIDGAAAGNLAAGRKSGAGAYLTVISPVIPNRLCPGTVHSSR